MKMEVSESESVDDLSRGDVAMEKRDQHYVSNGHADQMDCNKSESELPKKTEIKAEGLFQKFGNLFAESKILNKSECNDKLDENSKEVDQATDLTNKEFNSFESNLSENASSASVGLRPRRDRFRFENVKDVTRARKSIGRSPGSGAMKSTPTLSTVVSVLNISAGPLVASKSKLVKPIPDALLLKPKKKKRFKGATYSLYLSKKKKARQKSPKKDKNSEDDYDSEEGSLSITDSMVTLDSSHEDDSEQMVLGEEMGSGDGNLCLAFQDGDGDDENDASLEASKSSEDIADSNEGQEPDKHQVPINNDGCDIFDDDSLSLKVLAEGKDTLASAATAEPANNEAINLVTYANSQENDCLLNAHENVLETPLVITKVESLNCDIQNEMFENSVSEQNCDTSAHNMADSSVESSKLANKVLSDAEDKASIKGYLDVKADLRLFKNEDLPQVPSKDCDLPEPDLPARTNTKESQVKSKSEPEKAKKTPFRFQLRKSFTSLLKAGSKTLKSAAKDAEKIPAAPVPSAVNEHRTTNMTGNQPVSPITPNDDRNFIVNDMSDEDISNENSNGSQKLVISDLGNEDVQFHNPEEGNSCNLSHLPGGNQNLTDSNKENFGSISTLASSFGTQARRSFQDGCSSIATNVKSRQRIKRKIRDDHVAADCLSISSAQSEPDNILAKRLKNGLENASSLTGDNGSPMLNGTSPLLVKHQPLMNGDGILKKVTTCLCLSKSYVTSNEKVDKAPDGSIYCQAADSMYGRIVACCNSANDKQLHRTSVRTPFVYMCDVHKHRLRLHQGCPNCGLFCTEGIVLQCHSNPKSIHHFHAHCAINASNKLLCPHCGKASQFQEVRLELNTPQPLNFYLSREPTVKFPRAKMIFNRSGSALKDRQVEATQQVDSPLHLPKINKVISFTGIPLGPERDQLETLLATLTSQNISQVPSNHKELLTACQNNETEKFIQIVSTGIDLNKKFADEDNNTCLHIACNLGHLIIVHILIQAGATLDALNDQLKSPLHFAIEGNYSKIVHHLIKAGVDLSIKDDEGTTALHVSCINDRAESCKLILDTGFRPNIQDDGGWSPLVWASELGHLEIVKLLLERGADPYLQDNEQNIALHWSAFSGSVDISQIYLDHGCPLNATNINGDTPLHIASRQEKYECVVLFLGRQANVNAKNKANELPIDCCQNKDSQTWMALSMSNELRKLKPTAATSGDKGDKVIHRDISLGKEHYPIQCVNSVDEEQLPTNYLYIVQNCETSPIKIDRTITSLQSCNCEDDCTSPGCKCVQISLKCWYDKDGKLLPDFNFLDPPMLFECNRACKCWKNLCNNRVVQDGIMCRLQLFKTNGRGWGVRTLKPIPRGSFVCEYIGELMSDSEADQREDDSYLFDLDNRDGETFCIDARYYGNISRFVNHLCEPNVVPVKVFIDHQDLSFPRIAFFSSRDINAYEELGFDYGEKFWMIKYKWFTCECKSTKCKYSKGAIQTTLENYSQRMKEDHSMDQVKKASTVLINGTQINGIQMQ